MRRWGFTMVESLIATALVGIFLTALISYTRNLQKESARAQADTRLDMTRLGLRSLTSTTNICRQVFTKNDHLTPVTVSALTDATDVPAISVSGDVFIEKGQRLPGGSTVAAITLQPAIPDTLAQAGTIKGIIVRRRPALLTVTLARDNKVASGAPPQPIVQVINIYTAPDLSVQNCGTSPTNTVSPMRDFCDFVDGKMKNGKCQLPGVDFGGMFMLGDNIRNGFTAPTTPPFDTAHQYPDAMALGQAFRDRYCEMGNVFYDNKCGCPPGFGGFQTNFAGEYVSDHIHFHQPWICVRY